MLFKLIYVFYFGRLYKIQLTFTQNYGVDIFDPKLTAQLLAAVIVIDRIQHSGKNSTLDDD